ncbi:phosphatase PAP2 family protein [Actinoplanes regularis]|uniref:phosphatase PAP2 family protein n=1 Tax=Actinoplanes regularis TaxID=52697 RepID=UPI0024A607E6|nr:phosphatase PAP2 family protein [Actinoplanes regularis]GLW34225.1 membrane protein [Actinoplanes regularis]
MTASDNHEPSGVRTPVLQVIGLSATAFVLLALLVGSHASWLVRFDAWVSDHARTAALARPWWRSLMAAVTVTGGTAVILPLAVIGCVVLVASGRWRQAVFVVVALTVTLTTRLAVLALIARPRPDRRLASAASYSFPSGHTTASATAALVLVLVCWPLLRTRKSRIVLASAAGVWAVAVGVSRVALVVHWPSDVLGGWLFATAVVLSVHLVICRTLGLPAKLPVSIAVQGGDR